MSSIGPEGGIVSTAKESMIFLKAFINGHFFPKEDFNELKEWRLLFGPGLFFYGVGIASQPISIKELKNGLIGHWGQTGSFSFYHPETDLYFYRNDQSVLRAKCRCKDDDENNQKSRRSRISLF